MKKLELRQIIKEEAKKILVEDSSKPSYYSGAMINRVFYSAQHKAWVIATSKGAFAINKRQSFIDL